MKKIFILSTFLFLVFIQKSFSQERWIYITSGGNNDFDVYFDNETIKVDNNEITVFIKYVYSNESKKYWDKKYAIFKQIYYCNKDYSKSISGTVYYRNGDVKTYEYYKYEDIIPDTIGEIIKKRLWSD